MHYTEEQNIPGLLLLIDFEKVFDSVPWSFIYETLKYFGFGISIIQWIKLFSKNAKLAVTQGGNLSDFFYIGRSCRQGDPVSTCLFVLCAEVLAIKIRNNKNIKGITINNTEYKLSQYADDTSVILDGSSTSLNETLNVLISYAKYSGLKINFDKTSVVWIGKKKYSTDTIKTRWKLSWGKCNFKLLEIHFNVELHTMLELNYKEKLSKMKNLIQIWKRRYLTPLGKIRVIKSILISLLTHLFIYQTQPAVSQNN